MSLKQSADNKNVVILKHENLIGDRITDLLKQNNVRAKNIIFFEKGMVDYEIGIELPLKIPLILLDYEDLDKHPSYCV